MESLYRKAWRTGELAEKVEKGREILGSCRLCPRACGVNRLSGERGFCRTGEKARVAHAGPHFGEEAPLVGRYGSGTVFLSFCNLGCVFCQNYEISHEGEGEEVSAEILADMMLRLQAMGCHNINWVTPTHVVPALLEAVLLAVPRGLTVPLVYNCGGYESLETLRLLEGVVDIYMPDFKFWDPSIGLKLTGVPDYPQVAREALREMYRQVGDLVLDPQGLARKGLLVRHLVMPERLSGTREVLSFLAREISPHTYVNLMGQYRPCGEAFNYEPLRRPVSPQEMAQAFRWAEEAGLERLDGKTSMHLR